MGLFIYDATQRIVTPLAIDLQHRTIQQLAPISATAPVRPKSLDSSSSTPWPQAYQHGQDHQSSTQEKLVNYRLTAFEIMTPNVVTLSKDASWQQARDLFQTHGIRHLVLTNEERQAVGLLVERDLLGYPDEPKEDITALPTRPLLSATPDTDVQSIALVMLNRDIDAVLVLAGQTIEGIVTLKDLLKSFVPPGLIRNQI